MKRSVCYLSLLGVLLAASCNIEIPFTPTPSNSSTPVIEPSTPTPSNPSTPVIEPSTPKESTPAEESSTPTISSPVEETTPNDEVVELSETNLFVVGDSTLCEFDDSTYYYPRYGYATQLHNYLDGKANIINYALSGRSSKDFTERENYQNLKNELSEGDYLLIGFGHNDEKYDDATRFTDASKPITDQTSFKYSLYENYIKLALEKGATPILAAPIVRASKTNDYSGNHGHITSNGDYRQAIIELGVEKNIDVIDLTTLTKNYYTEIGYDEAIYLHAMTGGTLASDGTTVIANIASVDTTHLNVYGAKMVAYMFANALNNSESSLANYIIDENLVIPSKEDTLVANPSYKYTGYTVPNLEEYTPATHFATTSEGWYGTAFGDTGGNPTSDSNGYFACETSTGVFKVGQYLEGNSKGKFASTSDGFAYLFRQVDATKNFTLTAKAKVLTTNNTKQAGFGLMLRDDIYLPANDKGIVGNYIASGFLCDASSMTAVFSRSSAAEITISSNSISSLYAVDDEATLSIVRLGQKVTVTVVYKDVTYTEEFLDFPLTTKDEQFMYIGMFANRGTTVEFSNVSFEITGDAIQA